MIASTRSVDPGSRRDQVEEATTTGVSSGGPVANEGFRIGVLEERLGRGHAPHSTTAVKFRQGQSQYVVYPCPTQSSRFITVPYAV
jgi:hypothetical protein